MIGMFPLLLLETRDTKVVNQVLHSLPKEKQGEFWAKLESMSYEEGEKIIELGSQGNYLHLILHGEAAVIGLDRSGREVNICTLGAGSSVGELELISGDPCIADVVAVSSVRSQRISKDDFLRIVGDEGLKVFKDSLLDSRYVYYRMSLKDTVDIVAVTVATTLG